MNQLILLYGVVRIHSDYKSTPLCQSLCQRLIEWKDVSAAANIDPRTTLFDKIGDDSLIVFVGCIVAKTKTQGNTKKEGQPRGQPPMKLFSPLNVGHVNCLGCLVESSGDLDLLPRELHWLFLVVKLIDSLFGRVVQDV